MTLPPEDPKLTVLDELEARFDPSNTPLADAPAMHTGWYNYASGGFQISISNFEHSTVDGGLTGITASSGDGHMTKHRAGTGLVNVWGRREDAKNAGPNGDDVPVKDAIYEVAREATDVIDTTDLSGKWLATLAVDDGESSTDPESYEDPVYRYELTVRYAWTSQTSR